MDYSDITMKRFILILLVSLTLTGCITTMREGKPSVRVFSADAQFISGDVWLSWPFLGDPLAWAGRKVDTLFSSGSATNKVEVGK